VHNVSSVFSVQNEADADHECKNSGGDGMKQIWIGLTLVLALSACGTQLDSQLAPGEVILNSRTKVIGTAPAPGTRVGGVIQNISELIAASPDMSTITFSAGSAYARGLVAGDLISAPPNQVTTEGFLRKVSFVYDLGASGIMVYTEETDLDEAILYADSEQETPLEQSDVVSIQYADGTTLNAQQLSNRLGSRASVTLKTVNVPFDNVLMCTSATGDKVTATGSLTASLKAFLKVKFGFFTIKQASAGIMADESLKLGFSGKCSSSIVSLDKEIAKVNFGTKVIWIGPLPVVIKPYISVKIGASGSITATASLNITQTYSGTYGVLWKKGQGFSPINDSTFTVTGLDGITASAGLSVSAFVRAEGGFTFYGVATLYAYAKPYVELTGTYTLPANTFNYSVVAGLQVGVGGRLKIFGKTLGAFDSTILDAKRSLIASTTQPFGTAPPAPTPTPTPTPNPNPRPCPNCQIP
jgi:hypothetical protein